MDLPEPLTPAGCDQPTDAPFPVELFDQNSDAAMTESAAVFRATLNLMLWAWRRRPIGCIPNVPDRFFRVVYVSPQWFRAHSDEVLRDFVLCSDGQLYHRGIAAYLSSAVQKKSVARDLGVTVSEWQQMRLKVFARDAHACQYCGSTDVSLDCDHVVPLSRGGITHLDNLVSSCFRCNRSKGAKLLSEWRAS